MIAKESKTKLDYIDVGPIETSIEMDWSKNGWSRGYIERDSDRVWHISYFCKKCGTVTFGTGRYFYDITDYANKMVCGRCGMPVEPGSRCPVCSYTPDKNTTVIPDFIKYNTQALCPCCAATVVKKEPFYFDYVVNEHDPHYYSKESGELLSFSEAKKRQQRGNHYSYFYSRIKENHYKKISTETGKLLDSRDDTPETRFKEVLDYYECVQKREAESAAKKRVTIIVEESENTQVYLPVKQVVSIKDNPDLLKQYVGHLISLETTVYSTMQRLEELYREEFTVDQLYSKAKVNTIKPLLENLASAKEKLASCDTDERLRTLNNYKIPLVPSKPQEPTYKLPGLFNKKKIEAENEALKRNYDSSVQKYKSLLAEYEDKKAQVEEENRQAVLQAKEDAKREIEKAEKALKDSEVNPPINNGEVVAWKAMLNGEIKMAEETLKKAITGRNELYAYEIIFGKYRNFIALSSFYEYLMSGRCSTLEGPDGAYNIYEAEIRADQVIAQLSDVLTSLEKIKNNQYMAYSQLSSINSSLGRLNNKMSTAIDSLESIRATGETTAKYMERVAANSDVIAYQTERAAFYAKKNAELTDALGFMTALK